jgi:hypothetical protein
MSGQPNVVLYSTTTPALAKVKADIARMKRILDNKRIAYEEVRALCAAAGAAAAMRAAAAARTACRL